MLVVVFRQRSFLFRLGSALGRGIHWRSPDTDREGALIANRWGASLCKTEHSPTNPATVGFKSGHFGRKPASTQAPQERPSSPAPIFMDGLLFSDVHTDLGGAPHERQRSGAISSKTGCRVRQRAAAVVLP